MWRQGQVCCLYCHHREQAHSYSFDRVHPHESGRAIGRHREQALLLQKIKNKPPPSAVALHHSTGRALARLQAFDLDLAFDLPAPSGGRVEVFIWGSGAKRRAAKPHTSGGGRREADRRRCPQMDTGAREHRALARCRTPGRAFLGTFLAFEKSASP